ncbi:MAG: hypothetical protein L3J78_04820, partial [Thermoplasmata archaeon]|nr:hypothetical protein [Thermoplasmata archaeon]
MPRASVAWAEVGAAFVLLYVGLPWTGFRIDHILGVPPIAAPITYLGAPFIFAGAVGLAASFTFLVGQGQGTPNPRRPPQVLLTTGPWAWTRNPIVLSHAAALFGLCLFLATLSGVVLVVVLSAPVH